jgi:hypothetical protein
MALASVTLSYLGSSYTFAGDDQTVLKGRLACDCEKSRLIREVCDAEFPILKCGSQIVVVSVTEDIAGSGRMPIGHENTPPRSRGAKAGQ